jgi:hypothetical protein
MMSIFLEKDHIYKLLLGVVSESLACERFYMIIVGKRRGTSIFQCVTMLRCESIDRSLLIPRKHEGFDRLTVSQE